MVLCGRGGSQHLHSQQPTWPIFGFTDHEKKQRQQQQNLTGISYPSVPFPFPWTNLSFSYEPLLLQGSVTVVGIGRHPFTSLGQLAAVEILPRQGARHWACTPCIHQRNVHSTPDTADVQRPFRHQLHLCFTGHFLTVNNRSLSFGTLG